MCSWRDLPNVNSTQVTQQARLAWAVSPITQRKEQRSCVTGPNNLFEGDCGCSGERLWFTSNCSGFTSKSLLNIILHGLVNYVSRATSPSFLFMEINTLYGKEDCVTQLLITHHASLQSDIRSDYEFLKFNKVSLPIIGSILFRVVLGLFIGKIKEGEIA